MRIAMVSTPFLATPPKTYGGTELMVHELVEGLVRRGHQVTLFATGDSVTSAELRSLYPQAQWPPAMLPDLNHVSWALQQAVEGGCEVVHAHSAVALALQRLLPPHLPLVYTLHHTRDEQLSAFYRHCREPWYVAISAAQRAREEPLARCEVIHHGLDPAKYDWSPAAEDYVAFLGRLAPEKGPHTAIDVAARAGREIRVAGDVHEVDAEFGRAEVAPRLTLPHVHYLGCLGMEGKVPLLRGARALLAPVEWEEPFGLALVEAMLCGCPVVGFPRGSLPELVEPGVTGFVVDGAREMEEVIRPGGAVDRFDRRRCRERAAERFGRDRMAADHERLYRRAIAEAGQARRPIRAA